MEKRKILYVTQEMEPYLGTETNMSKICRQLPQAILENGFEIRNFMPRYGCINERRHQLHEVIRLSGMNLVVNDSDQPLIIKVASIPSARMQVYFIDNEEYFRRKYTLCDQAGRFFEDNDERAVFFARGVLETVKKLGWIPDVIHCHGWVAGLVPVYLKTALKEDPIYQHAKVVTSLYSTDQFNGTLDARFAEKVLWNNMQSEDYAPDHTDYLSIMKESIRYSDAVVISNEPVSDELLAYVDQLGTRVLRYQPEEDMAGPMATLYDELIDAVVLAH
jgi:starch synthase